MTNDEQAVPTPEVDTATAQPSGDDTEDAPVESPAGSPSTVDPAPGEDAGHPPLYQTGPEAAAPTDAEAEEPDAGPVEIVPEEQRLPFAAGDHVQGRVVKVDSESVRVDLGLWVEGLVPAREVSRIPGTAPAQSAVVGEPVEAVVTSLAGPEGLVRLSLARIELDEAWGRIEQALAADGLVTGKVTEAVKGGLRLDVGVEGFLPASLVDLRPVQNLGSFLGQELTCRIIESDKRRFKVVLSRRAVLEEERRRNRHEVFEGLKVGDVRSGVVSSVTDIGAFVDVGGADGLVHVTELSWARVKNPKQFVKPGDEVQVKVLEVDRDRDRISLSMKEVQENPWEQFVRAHRVGEVVPGKIVKVVDFGAFVEVAEGVEGLVHVSELAPHRVERPQDVVKAGEDVQVRIVDIDAARRRLSLSIRAVDDKEFSRRSSSGGEGGQRRRGGGGGGGGRRRGGGGGRGSQSFGPGKGEGLSGSLDKDSVDALEALKSQLSGDDDQD